MASAGAPTYSALDEAETFWRGDAVSRFRRGDAATLERVYWTYVARVEQIVRLGLASARRVPGAAQSISLRDVEDLVQETFMRAFSTRARQAYDGERAYGPYVSTIARNVIADVLRARRRNPVVDLEDPQPLIDATVEEAPLADPQASQDPRAMAVVREYISRLPPELFAVHQQRYVLGTSQELAAKALNLTRQRVRSLERKLRSGLIKNLRRAGIART